MVERAGITVRTVSVGGTYNYEIAGTMAGVTEVLAGTYALWIIDMSSVVRSSNPPPK